MASDSLRTRAFRLAGRGADRLAQRLAARPGSDLKLVTANQATYPVDREGIDNLHLELLLGWFLRADSNCLDVGANEGRFLHHIVRRAPQGRHVAWEPLPELADGLRKTFPGVEIRQAALYDAPGESEYTRVLEDSGYSGLRRRSYPGEFHTETLRVPLERLDDVLAGDHRLDFMKVDVEGAEGQVFQGGLETIARDRPVIVFEHGLGGAEHFGTTPESVHDLLAGDAKLRIFDLDAHGPLSRDELAEMFHAGRRWNFVALP